MSADVKIEKNIYAEEGAANGTVKIVTAACVKIVSAAKALCPEDLGQLRNTLMSKVGEIESGFNGKNATQTGFESSVVGKERAPDNQKIDLSVPTSQIIGIAGTNSDHWFPEFGTRFQRAQPFLRPGKEVALNPGSAKAIAEKFGPEEMEKAFRRRRTVKL